MKCGPFHNQPNGPRGKVAGKYRQVVDPNQRFMFGIESMEMRRIVIIHKHLYDDPVKSCYFRHR